MDVKNCVCCGEEFNVNQKHPNQQYKKGHAPKAEMIECGCSECGIMIPSKDKWGRPRRFVNGHETRMRRAEVGRIFGASRDTPEKKAMISKSQSEAWITRPRAEINIGILPMKCKWCDYTWFHFSKNRRNNASCPNCHRTLSKVGIKPLEPDPNNPFLFCGDGCGLPIPPSKDGRERRYLQGHGPTGDIPCKDGCGTIIHNPDSTGRFREYVRGHNDLNIELPSKPEKKIIEIIEKFNLPFKYTGDKATPGITYKPDFTTTLEGRKLIMEVQGIYYHTGSEREIVRHDYLVAMGYSILYIWDDEIMPKVHKYSKSKRKLFNDEEIRDKILDFIK